MHKLYFYLRLLFEWMGMCSLQILPAIMEQVVRAHSVSEMQKTGKIIRKRVCNKKEMKFCCAPGDKNNKK